MVIAIHDAKQPAAEGAFDVSVAPPERAEELAYASAVEKIFRLAGVDAAEDRVADPTGVEQVSKDRKELRAKLGDELKAFANDAALSGEVREAEQKSWLRYGRYAAARDAVGARMFTVSLSQRGDGQPELKIEVAPAVDPQMRAVDPAMNELYVAIGETSSVFDTVLADYMKFWVLRGSKTTARLIHREFTEKLAHVARFGLQGGRPELGMLALTDLRNQYFRRVAPIVKNRYMKKLGLWCVTAFGVSVALYALVSLIGDIGFWAQRRSFFLLCAGSCVGAWASFAIRNVEFSFVRLAAPEADLVRPALRVAFVMALASLAGLALWTRFLSFSVNGVGSDLFRNNASVALLLGALFGLAERGLSTGLVSQAEGVAARFGAAKA